MDAGIMRHKGTAPAGRKDIFNVKHFVIYYLGRALDFFASLLYLPRL